MMTLLTSIICAVLAASPKVLIPAPAKVESGTGTYFLPENPTYIVNTKSGIGDIASCISTCGIEMTPSSGKAADIRISLNDRRFIKAIENFALPGFARESAYSLVVTPKGVDIRASAPKGVFYALQSLRQMLTKDRELEECRILDWPRLQWRGLMIDISRNFQDKHFLMRQIDVMARLKMNKLHLHLTDDAGWRIQIDSHPELTRTGAWRIGKTWRQWRELGCRYSEEGNAMASGGYLTKSDIREIVAYASDRQIDIIPEFEIPGHSREVLEAYPELGCTDSTGKFVKNSDMCPGNPHVFKFIEDVIGEICELFPSEYIHIGGDEASRAAWKDCPCCRQVMSKHGITDVTGLQSWMTGEVQKIVAAQGRRMIGWDEIMEGGLADGAAVMCWRGEQNGLKAMEAGHDVVMSPNGCCYLDYTQDAPFRKPDAIGGYIPLRQAYSYNADISDAHLLGIQGNLWTEMLASPEHAEYMLYPRAFAIAETGWSPVSEKDYPDFRDKASLLCSVLRSEGYCTFDIDNEFGDRPESCSRTKHLALGKPVHVLMPYSMKYSAAGDASLTDGLRGTWSYSDGRWMGFCSDMDVIIDLEEMRTVHYAGASFIAQRNNYVALPERIEVYLSDDGENYELAGVTYSQLPADTHDMAYVDLGCVLTGQARYVRFRAFRRSMEFHDWLFTDEIIIN